MADEFANPVNLVIKKAWLDDEFRERLLRDPRDVLREYGIDIEETNIHVHVNSASEKHLVIPELPKNKELTDADMERLVRAGATCQIQRGFFGTCL